MKQKNKNTKKTPSEDMRMNVLKSGLCDDMLAGVLDKNSNKEKATPQKETIPQKNTMAVPKTDEEILAFIESCRGNQKKGEVSVQGLLCKVYDLVMQKNKLIEIIQMLESNTYNAPVKKQSPKQEPKQELKKEQQEPTQKPKSTGSTRQTMKKRGFIPKSQVEQMSRAEIREMFDLIDASRKEW